MLPRSLLAVSLVFAPLAAQAQPVYETGQRGGVINVPTDDREMAAAMEKGRATLPEFLALAASPKRGQRNFAVKVGFRGPQGRNEFFWVTPFTLKGDRVSGTLSNTPVYATQLREGQTVSFGRDEIVDWSYLDNAEMHGHYTTCVILRRSSDADRAQFRKQMGLSCDR
jgi:uncharacterized protein YegJ (DUF2314 family)